MNQRPVIEIDARRYCDAYHSFLSKRGKYHNQILLNKFKRHCGIEHLCRQYRMQPPVYCPNPGQQHSLYVVDERRWIIARLKYGI